MQDIYLCDIDGTLANHDGIRSPYDESKVLLDKPLPTCEVIKALEKSGKHIIFFSGRTEACRLDTITWLKRNIGFVSVLYMREVGDRRNDAEIKKELYENHIKNRYNVLAVFDDRLKVVKMWESLNIFVFNCNQGLKEF
jgi:hypothetical protein